MIEMIEMIEMSGGGLAVRVVGWFRPGGRAGDMSDFGTLGSGTGYGISLWFGVVDGLSHRCFFSATPFVSHFFKLPRGWG